MDNLTAIQQVHQREREARLLERDIKQAKIDRKREKRAALRREQIRLKYLEFRYPHLLGSGLNADEKAFLREYKAEQRRSDDLDYDRYNGIPQPRRVSIR